MESDAVRALRFDGNTCRLVMGYPDPIAAPGEAIVRPRRVGINPADAAMARASAGQLADEQVPNEHMTKRGALADSPFARRFAGTIGHEFVGVVESLNLPADAPPTLKQRQSLKGRRVVASPSIVCGNCDMCRAGLSAHCRARQVLGLAGRDGCLADRIAIPLTNLHSVPDAVNDDAAVLAVPLAAALHTARLVRFEARTYVTVLGDTLIGLVTAQALARRNASVRLLGSRPERLRLCERWGVKHRLIEEAGRRQDQDAVIDCTGTAAGLRLAMQHVRPRGTIVLMSPVMPAPLAPGAVLPDIPPPGWNTPVDLTPLVAREIHLLGSREGSIADALAFMEREGAAELDIAGLITRRFRFDDALAALRAADNPAQIKVVIDF
jgi:threonine dehydrogenase-like Zn-dependent dehydrogenase